VGGKHAFRGKSTPRQKEAWVRAFCYNRCRNKNHRQVYVSLFKISKDLEFVACCCTSNVERFIFLLIFYLALKELSRLLHFLFKLKILNKTSRKKRIAG